MFKKWLKAALIRALKTVAQTASSLITVGVVASEIDWGSVVSVSLVAGVYSMLTSISGLPEVKEDRWLSMTKEMEEELSNGRGEDDEQ